MTQENKDVIRRNLADLIASISKRPGMYVGSNSLCGVSHYLNGYEHALRDFGHAETPLAGWGRWLELKFMICSPAWHWTRILLHKYGTDEAAIQALPILLAEYFEKFDAIGLEGILSEHDRQLKGENGFIHREPENTKTTIQDSLG